MTQDRAYAQQRQWLVETQLEARNISDPRVLEAMRSVPRHEFVPPEQREAAYEDRALSIGHGQTISQPYMVALMCELLEVRADHKVLEVGAGSGYQAAVLGKLAGEVWAVEIIPELVERAGQVLARLGYATVHVVQGDGSVGYPAHAPFDRIIVAAGAPELPAPLEEQLAPGGRIVAPVGPRGTQTCMVGALQERGMHWRKTIPCVFVPLVGEHGWKLDDAGT